MSEPSVSASGASILHPSDSNPHGVPIPAPPGSDPRDGKMPNRWWVFDPDFRASLQPFATRGLADGGLTDKDIATLKMLQQALKSARAKTKSDDKTASARGLFELAQLVGYVSGLMDGKKLPSVGPGALAIGGSPNGAATLDEMLDHLEGQLQALTTPTREIASALVLGLLGGGLMLTGAAIKLAAAQLPD